MDGRFARLLDLPPLHVHVAMVLVMVVKIDVDIVIVVVVQVAFLVGSIIQHFGLLLAPLGRGHFGRVLLAPLGPPVLEPNLPERESIR